MVSTKQMAKLFNLHYSRIVAAIFEGRIMPPAKLGSSYMWDRLAVEKASWVLRHRGIDDLSDVFLPELKVETKQRKILTG